MVGGLPIRPTECCMQPVKSVRFWAGVFALFFAVFPVPETVRVVTSAEARPVAQQPATPTAGVTNGDHTPKHKSYLEFFFNALGIRYTLAFLVISFTFVAFLVMNLMGLRRAATSPPHLGAAFENQLNQNKPQEAFDLAKNDDSMLGQILAAGMQNVQSSYEKAEA